MKAIFLSHKILSSFLLIVLPAAMGWASDDPLPVVPYPQKVEKRSGSFLLKPGEIVVRTAISDSNEVDFLLQNILEVFETSLGDRPALSGENKRQIWLGITAHDDAFKKLCERNGALPDEQLGGEGYVLLVQRDKIIVAAKETAGVFYGVQSLKQLIRAAKNDGELACLKITDWPEFRYRGMQDDISRGPIPTIAFLKEQIRRCAELKLNMLSYYIENVVQTESHGDFAPAGAAISIAEWRELSEYAAQYHIELVGNFQSFSHFEKILSFPQYRHLGESGRLLSPVLSESYELLGDIYAEMAPAFSSNFFNVNSDETWDLGRGGTKAIVDSLGLARVYANHLNRLYDELQEHGKRMMMWADIALEHAEILDMIPKDVVMLTWEYSPLPSYENYIRPLREAGFEVMVAPGVLNSNRLMPELDVARENIQGFVEDAAQLGVLGVLLTVWDDGGMTFFSRDWYGVAYSAEKSWNAEETQKFDRRFDVSRYEDKTGNVSAAIMKIMELAELRPTQELNDKIFRRKIIPDRGEHLLLNLDQWDRVQEICDEVQQLLKAARPYVHTNDLDYLNFTAEQYRVLAQSRMDMVAAAGNYEKALEWQISKRPQGREVLVQATDLVGGVGEDFTKLRNWFQKLWLQENHIYWLDHILAEYDTKLADVDDVRNRLLQAIADYDRGHYLPPPNDVRLDIEVASGNYFQGWLLCGPFPNPGGAYGSDIDYLEVMGGEENARPFAGEVITLPTGEKYRWGKINSPEFGVVDLASHFERNEMVLAYVHCRITSPKDQVVRATFGSNDSIELFLNGKSIFRNSVKRNLKLDEDSCDLPLKAGKNYLTLKIFQGKAGWGFSFRIPDANVDSHKYKYTIEN